MGINLKYTAVIYFMKVDLAVSILDRLITAMTLWGYE